MYFTTERTDTIMKKRIISGLAALAIVLSGGVATVGNVVVPGFDIAASAADLVYGDYKYKVLEDGTVEISGYTGDAQELVIPDSIDGKAVTRIGNFAFDYSFSFRPSPTSVIIPDSVTSIGDGAFIDCDKLTSVTIPRNVSSIGERVFRTFYGSALESIDVDPDNNYYCSVDGVVYNKDMTKLVAFPYGKTSVTFPDTLTSIDENTFYEDEQLESVIIPNGVKSIGESAFEGCKKLKSITIPESVESIGKAAFYDCTAMTSATLPKSNINFGKHAIGYSWHIGEGDPRYGTFVEDGPRVMENFKIYCYEGTSGEQYAKANKIAYELREDIEPANPVVTYTPGDRCVTLKWKAVKGAEKYAVEIYKNGSWTVVETTSDTSFVLRDLKPGVNYGVVVLSMFDNEWYTNYSNMISVTPYAKTPVYPTVTNTEYNETYHQFRLHWSEVEGAEKYGVTAYIRGKWRIVTQDIPATTTTYTSPKLKPGYRYKLAVCAKVDGNWQTDKINSRAVTVTVV